MYIQVERELLKSIIECLYHSDHIEITSRVDAENGKQHVVSVRYLEQLVDFGATSRFDPNEVAYWVIPNDHGYEIRINAGFLG